MRALSDILLLSAAIGALAAPASGAPARDLQRPPAGAPDPRLMVLTSADVPGATVTGQGYFRDADFPSVSSYDREFETGRVGSTRLAYVDSIAQVGRSTETTATFVRAVRRFFGTRQGRRLLTTTLLDETEGVVTNIRVGRPRALGVGPESFDLVIDMRLLGIPMQAHFAVFRVERVLGLLSIIGEPGGRVPRSLLTRFARVMSGRMSAQLGPRNLAAPSVSGTAAVGQTLTVSPGSWRGAMSFVYQWQRCDAAGVSCSPIAGAAAQTYVVTDADVGARIRVAVTARGSSGTATATSASTAVVPETGPPVNVSPPTITGLAQVAQTLTAAGAGTWSRNPTGFTFSWLRCDAAGGACLAIAGATASTYVVAAGDVGSTLRVAVTARNAAGETTAVSAQTAVVT